MNNKRENWYKIWAFGLLQDRILQKLYAPQEMKPNSGHLSFWSLPNLFGSRSSGNKFGIDFEPRKSECGTSAIHSMWRNRPCYLQQVSINIKPCRVAYLCLFKEKFNQLTWLGSLSGEQMTKRNGSTWNHNSIIFRGLDWHANPGLMKKQAMVRQCPSHRS